MWDMNRLPEPLVRQLCYSIREILEMKNMSFRGMMRKSFRAFFKAKHPGEPMPLTPLRAISYASAGGGFSKIVGAWPASAVMKIGYEPASGSENVYTNKVVLLDEAHNLAHTQTQYVGQLRRLRDLLSSAHGHVLVGFTGTAIANDDPADGRRLLNVIRGNVGDSAGDEGFLSSLAVRPKVLFPAALPSGLPDGLLTPQRQEQLVKRVELRGQSLCAYDLKRERGLTGKRLRTYCNVCYFASSFHDGKSGCKAKILASPESCCPKLLTVARTVAASPEKAVVMVSRSSGYSVILELLRRAASESGFRVATMEQLADFNHVSNLRGEAYRVLVADAVHCSEGVSFLTVRRVYLLDVPQSWSQFVQQFGRSVRMCGHIALPLEERTVVTELYVSALPGWMRTAVDCWSFRVQRRQGEGDELAHDAEVHAQQLARQLALSRVQTMPELRVHAAALRTKGPRASPLEAYGAAASRALTALGAADTSAQDMDDSSLVPETADETALRELARQTEVLVPALAALRSVAVDRQILASTVGAAAHLPLKNAAAGDALGKSSAPTPARKRLRLRGKTTAAT
jgi:hypothetical protein